MMIDKQKVRFAKKSKKVFSALLQASLLMLIGPVVSCSSSTNSNLSFTTSVQQVVLINASTFSCTALATATSGTAPTADINANFFQIPQITINWTKQSSPLNLIWVTIVLNSSGINGGSYTCQTASSDLMYDWVGANYCPTGALTGGGTSCVSTQNPQIYWNSLPLPSTNSARTSTATYTSNQCSISCGGIKLVDSSKTIQGVGTIYIYGTYTDGSTLRSATSQMPITFTYQGAGPPPTS